MVLRKKQRKKRRTTVRVTLAGWVFLLMSLLIGIAAVRTREMPMMFILFGVMLGGMAVSLVISRGMVLATGVHRELPARAWQYETLYFGYFLRNTRRLASLGLTLQETSPQGVEDSRGYCVHLPARSVFRAGSRLTAARRGRIELEGISLTTRFPFGLAVIKRLITQPASLVVWPAKGIIKTDLLRHGAMISSSAQPGRLQGGQDEFFGLRDYRIGDNPRWIHWRRSAGREEPIVREMAHPVPDVLFLLLDVRLDEAEPLAEWLRERLLRFTATVIDHALGRGYQVGMALAGQTGIKFLAPKSSVGARCDMLDALSDVRDPITITVDQLISQLPPGPLRSAQAMLISPAREKIDPNRLVQLSSVCRCLRILAPDELGAVFEDNPLAWREDV